MVWVWFYRMWEWLKFLWNCVVIGWLYSSGLFAVLEGISATVLVVLQYRKSAKGHAKIWERWSMQIAAFVLMGSFVFSTLFIAPFIQFHESVGKAAKWDAALREVPAEKTSPEGIARKQAIQDMLGALLVQGNALLGRCANASDKDPTLENEANEWCQKIVALLQQELGPAYVARFWDVSGFVTLNWSNFPAERQPLANGIYIRLCRLQEFLKELALR